jgi:alpha-L-fucosidase
MLDPKELAILEKITKWMSVNGEAIYGTRPWKIYGEGPEVTAVNAARARADDHHNAAAFTETSRKPLTAADIRFTKKGATLYAFSMGRPEGKITLPALAQGGQYSVGRIRNVELLGSKVKLNWTQDKLGLTIKGTPSLSEYPTVFKIVGAQG